MADIAQLGIEILSDDIVKATKRLDKLERQSKQSEGQNKKLGSSFGMLGSAVTAFAGTLAVGNFFKTAASFETMAVSLETVTGSAEKATMAMAGIQEFAKNTPFQVEEITSAFIKLKALGINPTEESLRSFGNTSSAMGKSLDQMIEAVADASTGEFERLKEFGIKAKTQGDEIKFTFQGVTTTVRNSAKDITGYLEDIGKNKFAGAMSKQMDTLNGKVSNLGDSFDKLIIKLAADQSGAKGILDIAIESVDWLTEGITDARVAMVQTLAGIEIFFTKIGGAAEKFKATIGNIFSAETREKEIALIEKRTQVEIDGIVSAAEAYKTAELAKAEVKGSIAEAGKSTGIAPVDEDSEELTEKQKREIEREKRKQEKLLEQEQDYLNRLYNLQSGSAEASAEFSQKIKEGEYKNSLKFGSLMLSNAAKQNKEAFELQKAFALANAIATLPSAVMKSFDNGGGYPWGLIPAGLMLAQGLQQINSIRSTSFGSKSASGAAISGGTSPSAPVASGLPEGSTALPDRSEQQQEKVVRYVVEGESAHSNSMRDFIKNLESTLVDMGSDTRIVLS